MYFMNNGNNNNLNNNNQHQNQNQNRPQNQNRQQNNLTPEQIREQNINRMLLMFLMTLFAYFYLLEL